MPARSRKKPAKPAKATAKPAAKRKRTAAQERPMTMKQEAFVRAFIETGRANEAYRRAYGGGTMSPHVINVKAYEIRHHPRVAARIAEMRAMLDQELVDRYRTTKERVIAEYHKIAFADLRKTVNWRSSLVQDEDNAEGGDTLVIRNTYNNQVDLVSSEDVDEDTAAAIAEVSQTQGGGVKVKLHDKVRALDSLARTLGIFVDKTEVTGKDGVPLVPEQEFSNRDLARAILDVFREAKIEQGADK